MAFSNTKMQDVASKAYGSSGYPGGATSSSFAESFVPRMDGWMRELNVTFAQVRPNRRAGTTVMTDVKVLCPDFVFPKIDNIRDHPQTPKIAESQYWVM